MENYNDPFNEMSEDLILNETEEQRKARFKKESEQRLQEDLERYKMMTGSNLKFLRRREVES